MIVYNIDNLPVTVTILRGLPRVTRNVSMGKSVAGSERFGDTSLTKGFLRGRPRPLLIGIGVVKAGKIFPDCQLCKLLFMFEFVPGTQKNTCN